MKCQGRGGGWVWVRWQERSGGGGSSSHTLHETLHDGEGGETSSKHSHIKLSARRYSARNVHHRHGGAATHASKLGQKVLTTINAAHGGGKKRKTE